MTAEESAAQTVLDEAQDLKDRVTFAVRAMLGCGIIFLIAASVAFWQFNEATASNEAAIAEIESERSARVTTVAKIIDQSCSTNNQQDQLLASLIHASLEAQTRPFGSEVAAGLTPFDANVLKSIARIQALSASTADDFEKLFQTKLEELRDLTPCQQIVARYLASGTS